MATQNDTVATILEEISTAPEADVVQSAARSRDYYTAAVSAGVPSMGGIAHLIALAALIGTARGGRLRAWVRGVASAVVALEDRHPDSILTDGAYTRWTRACCAQYPALDAYLASRIEAARSELGFRPRRADQGGGVAEEPRETVVSAEDWLAELLHGSVHDSRSSRRRDDRQDDKS
jgi:hypothetical protein